MQLMSCFVIIHACHFYAHTTIMSFSHLSVKGIPPLLVLCTIVLLLSDVGHSLPPLAITTLSLQQRAELNVDDPSPGFVYRGEMRSPDQIRKAGGFYSRGLQLQQSGKQLSGEQLSRGSSLFEHALGLKTTEYTRYVSTSADTKAALKFAIDDEGKEGKTGYVFKVRTDKKMVAVNPSLGSYSPFRYQKEHAVVGFIPQGQIVGWYKITDETHSFTPKGLQEAADKIQNNKLAFTENPAYDEKKYAKKRGGARPELAGFPKDHKAWAEKPWKEFKDKPVEDVFEQMLQRICGKVKAKRDTSCSPSFGSQGKPIPGGSKGGNPNVAPDTPNPKKPPKNGNPMDIAPGPARSKGKGKEVFHTRLTLRGTGSFAAGALLVGSPFLRDGWENLKRTNTVFGKAAQGFDTWMASIQEFIGGPLQPDIYGNALKKKIITGMGKALQLGFETINQKWEREAAERKALDTKILQMAAEINTLLQACDESEEHSLDDTKFIEEYCPKLRSRVKAAEAKEEEEEKRRREEAEARMREWQESSEKLAEETRKAKEEWEKMEEEKKRKAEERKKTEELRRKQEARKRACRVSYRRLRKTAT